MQKTAYEMRISDWSSDVCSSDLRQSNHESPTSCSAHQGRWAGADECGLIDLIQCLRPGCAGRGLLAQSRMPCLWPARADTIRLLRSRGNSPLAWDLWPEERHG